MEVQLASYNPVISSVSAWGKADEVNIKGKEMMPSIVESHRAV